MLSLLSLLWGVTVLLNAQICCRRRANLWPDPLARPPPPLLQLQKMVSGSLPLHYGCTCKRAVYTGLVLCKAL